MLKFIFPCLTLTLNLALLNGTFPKKMQTAKVLMLYKCVDKSDLGNYGQNPIFRVFSKGFEIPIHEKMNNFCDETSMALLYHINLSTFYRACAVKPKGSHSMERGKYVNQYKYIYRLLKGV